LAVTLNSAENVGKSVFRTTAAGIVTARNVKALSATSGLKRDSQMCLTVSIFTMFSRFPKA